MYGLMESSQGVRQGCVVAMVVQHIMDSFVGGVLMSNTKVQVLMFADDIVLVAERKEVIISADGSSDEDIEQKIGAATRVVGATRKEVMERRD